MLAAQVGAVREELAAERRLKEKAEQAVDRERRTLQLACLASGAGNPRWHPKNSHVTQHGHLVLLQILQQQLQEGKLCGTVLLPFLQLLLQD